MSDPAPACRSIPVFAFGGERSRSFVAPFYQALHAEKSAAGPGPSSNDCLLYLGHTGVSVDGGATIFAFSPDAAVPVWRMLDGLKNGDAFPGVVRDDTAVFTAARKRGLAVVSFEVVLPDPRFQVFKTILDGERRNSQYSYGFPNGDGDCNCTTWLERIGLPLLTGRMNEFIGLPGISSQPRRRFGRCV